MIDKTTKLLLAAIAVCLAILAVRTFQAPPVQAVEESILRVDVVRIGGTTLSSYQGTRIIQNLSGG